MFDCISDSIVKWEVYNNEIVCENFPCDDWLLIVSDIKSDDEWREFLNVYCEWVKCYILRTCSNNKEIGFVYIYNESGNFDIISIHGGGWEKSIVSTLFYYRGIILIVEHLLNKKIKVRTTISTKNSTAIRFMRSIGFVPYRYTDSTVYMWINEKRLKGTRLAEWTKSRMKSL